MTFSDCFAAPSGGTIKHVRVQDGIKLRVGVWRPISSPRATIVLLGGRSEFIEKYHEVIGELLARRFIVWTCDWRGQGLSARMLPNRHKGHIDDYDTFIRDLRQLLAVSFAERHQGPRIVLAHSMGGHIALRYSAEEPDWALGLMLSAPMVDIRMSKAGRLAARLLAAGGAWVGLGKTKYIPGTGDYGANQTQFENNVLTHDRARFGHMVQCVAANPDLALGGPTVGWLAASLKSIDMLRRSECLQRIRIPILISSASADTVVSNGAQRALCQRLALGRFLVAEGARHEVLMETDEIRQQFWAAFDSFINRILG